MPHFDKYNMKNECEKEKMMKHPKPSITIFELNDVQIFLSSNSAKYILFD